MSIEREADLLLASFDPSGGAGRNRPGGDRKPVGAESSVKTRPSASLVAGLVGEGADRGARPAIAAERGVEVPELYQVIVECGDEDRPASPSSSVFAQKAFGAGW